MNETRRCPYCQSSFLPSRYRPQQRVCSRPDCQRQRRANSRLQKLATDLEYRQVVRDSQKQFNTGARVQEIADLRVCDLQLTRPFQVRLFGKGRKERYCPLWPQTAAVLRAFCKERNLDLRPEVRLFLNHRNEPLTRFGIRHILARRLERASQLIPNLRRKRLHPHRIRHSTAFALLKSGVDLSTVGHYLGHASLTTTNRYAKLDLEMKRKAITRVKPVTRQPRTPWRRNPTILDWLESL